MQLCPESSIKKCRCGAKARIRQKTGQVWIECRNKFCHIKTRYYTDENVPFDTSAEERAIAEWNEMMGRMF